MAPPASAVVRFHLSLNVGDLARSVEFYRTLFGVEPAKRRADYAKFELDDPPVVLSLEPNPRPAGGALNHLGFRMPSAAALVAMQERLELAGIRSKREEGVECCYARQTKFWVLDPDGTLWEFYTLEEDLDHRGPGQTREAMIVDRPVTPEPVVYEHRLSSPVPERIPLADGTVDEVRLRGSLNLPLADAEKTRIVREAMRVLRPGGRLFVHTLVGESEVIEPKLPGPAGSVQFVPLEDDPVHLLEGAGFRNVRLVKFAADPCFHSGGIALREQQLEGYKPGTQGRRAVVVYKGPLRSVTADDGTVYMRGERVVASAECAAALARETGDQFLILWETTAG
jgi:catechol 2,3-dioxygenase-like lactoylglutathione lyase family enzyme